VREECGYPNLQNLSSPTSDNEQEQVREFLHNLDGYGRKKLETEELF
jgi:hypothetical protein